jgi:hypothetical protein
LTTPQSHAGIGVPFFGSRAPVCEDDGESSSPLQIGDQCRTKFGIVGNAALVGAAQKQVKPVLTLFFGQAFRHMSSNHRRVATQLTAVRLWSAENLGDEAGDVITVLGSEARE